MSKILGSSAVVIGGSMTGLMTARVLADRFDQVLVIERDTIDAVPSVHKSIPQGNHYHALLLGGQQVLSSLWPDFIAKLRGLGAVPFRIGVEVASFSTAGKSYSQAAFIPEPQDLGFGAHTQSRGLIEHCVRELVHELPNVKIENATAVRSLLWQDGRVRGLRFGESSEIAADLVVDASGRGSRAPVWLRELGFGELEETTIGVDFSYASTKFRIPKEWDEPLRLQVCFSPPPGPPRGAIMGEIEDGVWHLSLAGRFGEYPPTDEEGFLAFARSIPTERPYVLIKDAERVAEITRYRFPTSVQRHYERLETFPEGLVVLGDAICSFNPVYGQGMSSAALQVAALRDLLAERADESRGLERLALDFFPKAAEVVATPWTLAAAQDLAHPQTTGERPPDMAQRGAYFAALGSLAAEDIEVSRTMAQVFHLVKPFSALLEEPLLGRALARQQQLAGA